MARIIFIAFALALDAFGVSLGIGCSQKLKRREQVFIIISFGFFQALFSLTGAILGRYINMNFFDITGYLSGGIITLMGLLLLKEGFNNQKNEEEPKGLNPLAYIVLGISVSIDALGVGFSVLYQDPFSLVAIYSIYIGLVASFLTGVAFPLSKSVKNIGIVEKYADYIGGVILVIFGIKMLIG